MRDRKLVADLAALSLDAYNADNNKDMPEGWACFNVSGRNDVGYFGKCYTAGF